MTKEKQKKEKKKFNFFYLFVLIILSFGGILSYRFFPKCPPEKICPTCPKITPCPTCKPIPVPTITPCPEQKCPSTSETIKNTLSLYQAMHSGTPFKEELNLLSDSSDSIIRDIYKTFSPFAEKGIPTYKTIKSNFEKIYPNILKTIKPLKSDTSLSVLNNLIKIKKIAPTHPNDIDILNQIKTSFDYNNFEQAISLIKKSNIKIQNYLNQIKTDLEIRQKLETFLTEGGNNV